jgi:hypothetical protein
MPRPVTRPLLRACRLARKAGTQKAGTLAGASERRLLRRAGGAFGTAAGSVQRLGRRGRLDLACAVELGALLADAEARAAAAQR